MPIAAMGLEERVRSIAALRTPDPLGYLDFLKLMSEAAVVLTDSGGIQEETTILGVPCLTLRANTERPVTITHGTNRLCPVTAKFILAAFADTKAGGTRDNKAPELWDGQAAERIAQVFIDEHVG